MQHHPVFQQDRALTGTLLKQRIGVYEDVFRELAVILGLPPGTPVTDFPAAVEECMAGNLRVRTDAH